jgi:hypothetical protein
MQVQAASAQRGRATLASRNFLGGSPHCPPRTPPCVLKQLRRAPAPSFDATTGLRRWHGWGMTPGEHALRRPARSRSCARRRAASSQLKWAFAFQRATRARSQPTVGAGALYVGSQSGTRVRARLDTGCVRWTFAGGSRGAHEPGARAVAARRPPGARRSCGSATSTAMRTRSMRAPARCCGRRASTSIRDSRSRARRATTTGGCTCRCRRANGRRRRTRRTSAARSAAA